MYTDQFNHAPAQLLMHTGSARLGRPSLGSWVSYGLGSENENLPGFMVLASGGKTPTRGNQPGEVDSSPPFIKAFNADQQENPFYLFKILKVSILISEKQALTQSIRSTRKHLRNLVTQKQSLELPNMRWLTKCKARCPKSWTSARSLNTFINYMEPNRGRGICQQLFARS